jgi:hypothetical protein
MGEFGGVVEGSENHRSGPVSGWSGGRRGRECGQVGPRRGGKSHQPFRVQGVGSARGIGPGVREPDVHRRKAGGIRITEVADLKRCDPSGKYGQAIETRVPGEIDQDIRSVFAHAGFHRCVGPGSEVAPERGLGLQPDAGGVGHHVVVVKHQLELGTIQMSQEWLQKIGD